MREKQQAEKLRKNPNQDHREESTDTHSAKRWRLIIWLAGLVLISSVLLGSQAAAKDLAPNPHKNCTDNKNYHYNPPGGERPPCDLWRSVEEACISGHDSNWSSPHWCYNKGTKKLNNQNPPVVIVGSKSSVTPCHFMAVPTVPVIGIEDAANRGGRNHYWTNAWDAATLPAPKPDKINQHRYSFKQIGLAVNPPKHRTQHQLHIHIGNVPSDIRKKLLDHLPHHGTWSNFITIKDKSCVMKYIKGKNVPDVFNEVSQHAGEQKMQNLGIILAGHVDKNGHLDGFIILSCEDACVEKWLDYTCPRH